MWLDRIDDKSKLNLLQEEERGEGGGSPPSSPERPGGADQTIILQPVSQVKVAGVGDAGRQKEDWHQQD